MRGARLQALRGYAIAMLSYGAAVGLRATAGGWFQTHYPYFAFFLAVIATAYLAGLGPALVVATLSAVTAYFTYAPPTFGVGEAPTPELGGAAFWVAAAGCALVIAKLRAARDRLEVERKRYADLAESRDLLYRELQHRVSNNIQVVSGLLRLQAASASPAARRALIEAAGRIGLIAKIQRELYTLAGAPSPFRDFARDLLADVVAAAGAEQVTVSIEGGEAPLHPEQATAVALVLLECVNNALEHAYADGRGGAILIDLARENTQWRLTVRDDGPGPPPGLDIEKGQSFGLKIVRAMAGQLHGQFTLVGGDPGAICRLTYPALEP